MGVQPPIEVANLGMWDTLLLMVLALVVFGPRKLPQIGRQIGKLMYEFRKASNDFKFQMEEELRQAEEADRRKKEEEERQKALATVPPASQLEQTTGESANLPAQSPELPPAPPSAPEISDSGSFPSANTPETEERSDAAGASPSALPEANPPSAPEDGALRIQPPSTGEIVAAERPGPKPPPPADPLAVNDNLSGANEAERSEPAARHG